MQMKMQILYLLFLLQWGCVSSPNIEPLPDIENACSQKPHTLLKRQHVETINPRPTTMLSLKGETSRTLNLGYLFPAESGQTIDFHSRNETLCIWVYAPDNSQLTLEELELLDDSYAYSKRVKVSEVGQYIFQVGSWGDLEPFELDILLESKRKLTALNDSQVWERKDNSSPTYDFSKEKFPKPVCGDVMPSKAIDFPVTFFPIHIPFSEDDLEKAKELYCDDAFKTTDKNNGSDIVQIASFTDRSKAEDFLKYIEITFPEVKIGPLKTFDEAPSSQERNTSLSHFLIGQSAIGSLTKIRPLKILL